VNEYTDQPAKTITLTNETLKGEGLQAIRIAPDGEVRSRNGVFVIDREGAAEIIAEFQRHGVDLPVDYEHQTLGGAYASPSGKAPAAGWVTHLYHEPGRGLFGLIRWNPKAREAIRAKEYLFISPVLSVRKDDRRAIALLSAGLTNLPAIPASEKLAASTRYTENMTMPNQQQGTTKTGDDPTALISEIKAFLRIKTESNDLVAVLRAIRDWAEAHSKSEDEDKQVASSVRAQLGLEADAGKSEVLLALSLHGDSGRRAEVERDVDERIDLLCKGNTLNPNDHAQIAAARSLALEDRDRFEALVGRMKPYVSPGRTTPPPRPGVGAKSRHTVIASAARDFRGDDSAQKLTSLRAFVDLRLREAALPKATDDEIATIVA